MYNTFLWQTFITLFVIINPFAIVPVFIGLTKQRTEKGKLNIANKSCLIGLCLLIVFAFIGDKILDIMGISEPAFRIAGGFLLFLAAIDMVVGSASTKKTGDDLSNNDADVSVFPLAIPLISGPGALTSVVVLMRQAEALGTLIPFLVVLIIILVVLMVYASLLMAPWIIRFIGFTGTDILVRVFGIILSAIAIQSIINGILIIAK